MQTTTRHTAAALNPLISDTDSGDTLDRVSALIREFGALLTQIERQPDTELHLGSLYLITDGAAAALDYERSTNHV